ncbi:MAG TPA: thiamine pyrophosphate-binding protein [Chloroflexota bacterium]|nr:thiamine pyrophosphate-binding protein [Chloroflexota bacterium]
MNGADVFVRELVDRGVAFVTTLSGNGTEPFYAACQRAGLRLIDFRNEQAASFAADAAARLSGRLAVCAVSAAVGHVNALIGVTNAWYDGAPVLLFSGGSDHGRTDQGKFQDMDQIAVAGPLCKYAKLVDRPERISYYVGEAIAAATSGRPGPVHLTIPSDILNRDTAEPARRPAPASAEVRPLAAPDPGRVLEAAALIARAERPVIVAGSGAFYARAAAALDAVARATGAPVVVPIWDRGVIEKPSENYLGVIGAASGGPRVLPDADLVVLVGARIDYRVGYGESPEIALDAKVIRIDVDAAELRQGREPDLAILADPASALRALAGALSQRPDFVPRETWLAEARRRLAEFQRPWSGPLRDGPTNGRQIVTALRPFLDEKTRFLIDGGNIGQWAHVLADRYPSNWLTCGASGVVGWGIAGAIAAKLVDPDRPVILLSGDGAIGFGLPELETAVRQNTPFVCVLADDRAWGSVASGQAKRPGPDKFVASRLGAVDYAKVAEGFGALGLRAGSPEEIAPAVRQGLASGRPTLVHVPTVMGGPHDPEGLGAADRG